MHLSFLHSSLVGMWSTKVTVQRKIFVNHNRCSFILKHKMSVLHKSELWVLCGGIRGFQHQPMHGLSCRITCSAAVSLLPSSFSPFTLGCISTRYCALHVQDISVDIQATSNTPCKCACAFLAFHMSLCRKMLCFCTSLVCPQAFGGTNGSEG